MNTLKSLWAWFDGKKTFIGVALMVGTTPLFQLIEQPYAILGIGVPFYFAKVQALLIWGGTAIGTIGGIHKMIKMKADAPAS